MDDYIPNPLKNFTPRRNPEKKQENEAKTCVLPLTDDQLADKAFLRSLAMKELVAIVQSNKGDIRGVNACNALLDRVDGKPQQSMDITGKIGIIEIVMEAGRLRSGGIIGGISQQLVIDNADKSNG